MLENLTLEMYEQIVNDPNWDGDYPGVVVGGAKCLGINNELDEDYLDLYGREMDYIDVFMSALKTDNKKLIITWVENHANYCIYEKKDFVIGFYEFLESNKGKFTNYFIEEDIKEFLIKVLH